MINYQVISDAAYQNIVSLFIKITEKIASQSRDIGDGRATIGYGYTFNRNNNVAIWTRSGITLTSVQWGLLTQIDAAPATQKTALGLQFNFTISTPQANALLIASIPEYEGPANSLNMGVGALQD